MVERTERSERRTENRALTELTPLGTLASSPASRRVVLFQALASLIGCALLMPGSLLAQNLTPQEAVDLYGEAWAEPDEERRRELLERAWAEDGVYTDPTAEVKGREALVAHIEGFLEQAQGGRIVIASRVDHHHGTRLRFSWTMEAADGRALAEGMDYGELDEDGRLKLIVGFFGPFPPLGPE